ncbi:uncharacterized protein LOC117144273 [Drosophila mauritiana]|uniref:Uncharacterized protein LOC117144273 n=1 Tax=Drosophila mauritiana TaxID=7226 RepID=A0A6P8KAK0_DROMA|nr:uncharacterized protein LOC117144273 [Drosophila mauritiana]
MGNSPSAYQVGRRPAQHISVQDICNCQRSAERNRSRHCFVIRSQRPPKGVAAQTRCCCTPPAPISRSPPPSTKIRQRCCCALAPEPARQRVCGPSGIKPQRCCTNCPGNGHGGPAARRTRLYHSDPYPVMLGEDRKVALEEPILLQPDPHSEIPYSDSSRSLQPAVHAINENCQDPQDPYYPYPPRSTRQQEVDPLANFDLNRFDREAIHRGPAGRRRNVSIRTCVDYDYEPGYPAPSSPPGNRHPPAQSGYCPPRAQHPPAYHPSYEPNPAGCPAASSPRIRLPPASFQRPYHPRTHPGLQENTEFDYVKCPFR